ncbi:hypothetical protein HDU82_002339, partial [Entophlyctis luteolus]
MDVSAMATDSTAPDGGIQIRTFQASGTLLDEKQRQLLIQTLAIVANFLIGWTPYAV